MKFCFRRGEFFCAFWGGDYKSFLAGSTASLRKVPSKCGEYSVLSFTHSSE